MDFSASPSVLKRSSSVVHRQAHRYTYRAHWRPFAARLRLPFPPGFEPLTRRHIFRVARALLVEAYQKALSHVDLFPLLPLPKSITRACTTLLGATFTIKIFGSHA